MSLIVLKLRK
ncbi:hypothetical protein CGLO_01942 [Colletotrichum gloeosporioides Cg-14]|uniref:Uncharacterized protein n=1 Tax=Colletotrichum gloeosporioides (strain Cg-14) TaxID=1237896 RepID=T0L060_COLGC|nr:hypothetical protein CGLO_01942 [Colletotrichum gloeosporioides Cg-14]